MTPFKIGDIVECIGTFIHDEPYLSNFLKYGRKYNILKIEGHFVKIVDDETGNFCDYWFLINRFKPLNNQPDVDMVNILKGY